jgi:hypothetical protein
MQDPPVASFSGLLGDLITESSTTNHGGGTDWTVSLNGSYSAIYCELVINSTDAGGSGGTTPDLVFNQDTTSVYHYSSTSGTLTSDADGFQLYDSFTSHLGGWFAARRDSNGGVVDVGFNITAYAKDGGSTKDVPVGGIYDSDSDLTHVGIVVNGSGQITDGSVKVYELAL